MSLKKHNVVYYSLMRYKFGKIGLVLFAAIVFFACKSALYIPSKETVKADINIETLKKGRTLYVNNCSSCHALYLPERYSKKEWVKWVDDMAPRSKITNEEKKLIQAYLTKGE
jgi:hypothetical protein